MMEDLKSLIARLRREARRRGACRLFTGKESTPGEVFRLFKSPAGMEFCLEHGFPELEDMRLFKDYRPEDNGIYCDAGRITITDPGEVTVLAGDTDAVVTCSGLNPCGTRVYLMHGARAVVLASGWALVKVEAMPGCEVARKARDNARIL